MGKRRLLNFSTLPSIWTWEKQQVFPSQTVSFSFFFLKPTIKALLKSPPGVFCSLEDWLRAFFHMHIDAAFRERLSDISTPMLSFSVLTPDVVTSFPLLAFLHFRRHPHACNPLAWQGCLRHSQLTMKGTPNDCCPPRDRLLQGCWVSEWDAEPYKETLALVYKQNSAFLFVDWLPASFCFFFFFDICYHQRRA